MPNGGLPQVPFLEPRLSPPALSLSIPHFAQTFESREG